MISFPDYRKATNAAYHELLQLDSFQMAVDVTALLSRHPECRLIPYGQAPLPKDLLLSQSEQGFTILEKSTGNRLIFYNETLPEACVRFTLVHELAHAVLGHQDGNDPAAEKEANCFARNILCPVPVVEKLRVKSPAGYVRRFGVSRQMAEIAVQYRASDMHYISDDYYAMMSCVIDKHCFGFNIRDVLLCM